jgi:hypothetical protein
MLVMPVMLNWFWNYFDSIASDSFL